LRRLDDEMERLASRLTQANSETGLADLSEYAATLADTARELTLDEEYRAGSDVQFWAEAVRALYVDWKGGGQVNQNWTFAREWQSRWNWVREAQPPLLPAEEYASAGIDYVVVGPKNGLPGLQPVYSNASWQVFDVRPPASH